MEENESIMAAEPAVAYTPTMFDKVISYLHSSHMPIETKRAVYLQLQAEVADWSLFPNVNGTFLLQRKNAAISIGREEYSYFAEGKDKTISLDHQPLTIESVKSAIETINRYA